MSCKKPTQEMLDLLRRCADFSGGRAAAAQMELAQALTVPLQRAVLDGDILGTIFEEIYFAPGTSVEFPLDWLGPSNARDFVAYTIPGVGRIPERSFRGDYVMVPTYEIGHAIDWPLKYMSEARWDIVARALQALEGGFVRKKNNDGWHTLLGAGVGRNVVVYDDAAPSGLLTKRLISHMEISMRRNAGGNSTSQNRGRLTDAWMSPEAHADVLSWDLTQIPDGLRQQIYTNWGNGGLTKIGPVLLHELDELGVGQAFQSYFSGLGGTLPTDKVEIVVGLDLQNRDAFVSPFRREVEVFEDTSMHRMRRAGVYGWWEGGFSCLDATRVLLGAV